MQYATLHMRLTDAVRQHTKRRRRRVRGCTHGVRVLVRGRASSRSIMISADSVTVRPSSSMTGSRPEGTFCRKARGLSP